MSPCQRISPVLPDYTNPLFPYTKSHYPKMTARLRYECIIYDISMFKHQIEQEITMFYDDV